MLHRDYEAGVFGITMFVISEHVLTTLRDRETMESLTSRLTTENFPCRLVGPMGDDSGTSLLTGRVAGNWARYRTSS